MTSVSSRSSSVEAGGGDSGTRSVYPGRAGLTPTFRRDARRGQGVLVPEIASAAGTGRRTGHPSTRSVMNDERSNLAKPGTTGRIVDAEGAKIGRIADVYLDRDSQRPDWALVHTGLFGTARRSFPSPRLVERRRPGRALREELREGRAERRERRRALAKTTRRGSRSTTASSTRGACRTARRSTAPTGATTTTR